MDKDLVVLFRQGRRVFPLEYWVVEVKMVFPLGYPKIRKKLKIQGSSYQCIVNSITDDLL